MDRGENASFSTNKVGYFMDLDEEVYSHEARANLLSFTKSGVNLTSSQTPEKNTLNPDRHLVEDPMTFR
jgi:hypothetical protein